MWTLFLAAHASMRWYALRNHASTSRPGPLTLEAPSRNSSGFRKWVSSEDIRVLITRHVLKRHGGAGEPGEMQGYRCGPGGEPPRGAHRDVRGWQVSQSGRLRRSRATVRPVFRAGSFGRTEVYKGPVACSCLQRRRYP